MPDRVVRVAHLADVHLGATPYNMRWRMRDILESLQEAVSRILENRADLVVVAGDFFDRPRPENTVILDAINALRPLAEKGVPIVFAYGEHDYPKTRDSTAVEVVAEALHGRVYAPPRPLIARAPSGITISNIDKYTVEVDGTLVLITPFFLGNPSARRSLILEKIYPYYERLVERHDGPVLHLAHITLEHVFPHGDLVVPLARMPRADYTALGHLHWRIVDVDNEKPYAYPGSLEPLKRGEAERRLGDGCTAGFLMADIGVGGGATVESVCLENARPQLVVEATPEEARSRIRTELLQRGLAGRPGKKPLVYLTLTIPRGHGGYSSTRLARLIRGLRDELGVELHVRIEKRGEAAMEAQKTLGAGGGGLDVRYILARLLGVEGDRGIMLAERVLQLKDALLEGDEKTIDETLSDVLRFSGLIERDGVGRGVSAR